MEQTTRGGAPDACQIFLDTGRRDLAIGNPAKVGSPILLYASCNCSKILVGDVIDFLVVIAIKLC